MVKAPSSAAIEEYRKRILTNPETFRRQLEKVREELRSRCELFFIERDLTIADESQDKDQGDRDLEKLDRLIMSFGQRIEAIDETLDADEEAQKELFKLGRKDRRSKDKEQRKDRAAKAKALTDPIVPVDGQEEGEEEEEDA